LRSLQLAELHYGKPGFPEGSLPRPKENVRKEVELVSLLQSGYLDYHGVVTYSLEKQHPPPCTLELPEGNQPGELNRSNFLHGKPKS
jgi:hypothetical protein